MKLALLLTLVIAALPPAIHSADNKAAEAEKVESYTLRPEKVPFEPEHLRQLKLPSGFQINVFATNMGNARMMLPAPSGGIYLTRYNDGDVLLLLDTDRDGKMDRQKAIAKIPKVHGIAIHEKTLILADVQKLYRADLQPDGSISEPQAFAPLPDGGQHPRRTLGIGPDDGLLYVSIGSTCNNCKEPNPEHATMLTMRPDGSNRSVFAKGLRNTIGFDWHPQTKQLWGFDHGSDERGNDIPPEELNLLKRGADYGWPWCYGKNKIDSIAQPPENSTKEQHCAKATGSTLEYQAHAAPIAFIFYRGEQFPEDFRGDGFFAFHGSWNRKPAVGYSLARLHFENGQPTKIEDFLTGFLLEDGKRHFGRPAGLAVTADGALLISDDDNGVIYRVSSVP